MNVWIPFYIYKNIAPVVYSKRGNFQLTETKLILLTPFSDLGKILALPSFGELPQWAVVGESGSLILIRISFSFSLLLNCFKFESNILIEWPMGYLQEIHFLWAVPLMSQMFIIR